jgi:hypothetical protein
MAAPKITKPVLVAAVLAAIGCAYRLVLLAFHMPASDGDEATIGLMALHVSQGRQFPSYFYGADYMGSLEAYLAAPMVWLHGASALSLRLPMTLATYALFLVSIFVLTRRTYGPWFAVAVVGVLALGSDHVVKMQLRASGGYPEIPAIGTLLFLTAVLLGERSGGRWRRLSLFAAFGLLTGLVLWLDWLLLPYVGAAGLVLLAGSARDLLGWATPVLLVGAAIGATPAIAHLVNAPAGHNVLADVLSMSQRDPRFALGDQLHGALTVGLPMTLGLCPSTGCGSLGGLWAAVCLGLLLASAVLAVVGMRDRGERLRHVTQFCLVVAAVLTIFMYARSSAAAAAPLTNSRYLQPLLISLPAFGWPLWAGVRALVARRSAIRVAAGAAAGALAAAIAVALVATTAGAIGTAPTLNAAHRDMYKLIGGLRALGVTRVYSDYGTCNQLIFFTSERVACAVVVDDGHRGLDRYLPYRQAVDDAPAPAFVAVAGSVMQTNMDARVDRDHIEMIGVETIAGFRVYRPRAQVRPFEYE